METKRLSARDQSIEAERFQNMMESDSFRLFTMRVASELERARETCERGDEELALRRAQGAAAALRTVTELPRAILHELKQGRHAV